MRSEGTDHQQDQADWGDMGMVGGKPQPGHPPPQLPPPPSSFQPFGTTPYLLTQYPSSPSQCENRSFPTTSNSPRALCNFSSKGCLLISILHQTLLNLNFPNSHMIMKSWCFLNVIHSWCSNFRELSISHRVTFPVYRADPQVPNLESRPYVGWGVIQTHHRSSHLKTPVLTKSQTLRPHCHDRHNCTSGGLAQIVVCDQVSLFFPMAFLHWGVLLS